jgi:hypothetical protein
VYMMVADMRCNYYPHTHLQLQNLRPGCPPDPTPTRPGQHYFLPKLPPATLPFLQTPLHAEKCPAAGTAWSGSACVCAANYFGDGTTCTACVTGSTAPQGSSTCSKWVGRMAYALLPCSTRRAIGSPFLSMLLLCGHSARLAGSCAFRGGCRASQPPQPTHARPGARCLPSRLQLAPLAALFGFPRTIVPVSGTPQHIYNAGLCCSFPPD